MANFEIKFKCYIDSSDYIKCEKSTIYKSHISVKTKDIIEISGHNGEDFFEIILDKSTAIKFAKTLRTEINKITESEVDNA